MRASESQNGLSQVEETWVVFTAVGTRQGTKSYENTSSRLRSASHTRLRCQAESPVAGDDNPKVIRCRDLRMMEGKII